MLLHRTGLEKTLKRAHSFESTLGYLASVNHRLPPTRQIFQIDHRQQSPAPTTIMDLDQCSPEEIQTIVSTVSHDFPQLRRTVARLAITPPEAPSTLLLPLSSTNPTEPSSLGLLGRLPNELLLDICQDFTVQTAVRFSKTCRHARALCTSIPRWFQLATHAQTAIGTLLATGLAGNFTMDALHAVLTGSGACEFCGEDAIRFRRSQEAHAADFGAYLYLPTAERCCYMCIDGNQSRGEAGLIYLSSLARISGMSGKEIRTRVPTIAPMLGAYGITGHNWPVRNRRRMVSIYHSQLIMAAAGRSPHRDWYSPSTEDVCFAATTYFPYLNIGGSAGASHGKEGEGDKQPELNPGLGCIGCWEYGGLPGNDALHLSSRLPTPGFVSTLFADRLKSQSSWQAHEAGWRAYVLQRGVLDSFAQLSPREEVLERSSGD